MEVTPEIRAQQIQILSKVYAGAKPALHFRNPFELLVAVILSAQCTDKRVNIVTEKLFAEAATPEAMFALGQERLQKIIQPCGLFHNKAKNILATCQTLIAEHHSEVPRDFAALLKLPGVGRKTANVVASIAFHEPHLAVDTHVFRVANRLGLATGETPLAVEKGLMAVIPREQWTAAHHWLIFHGRQICKARKPLCDDCPLRTVCPSAETGANAL